MEYIERSERVPVREAYDVIVAGGGVAGAAAALAAARAGKRTLLIEKATALGGLATIGLINFFVPMCNGRGRQIIFGMAEEFLQLSRKRGYDDLPEVWKNGEPKEPTGVRKCMHYSHTIFALELTRLLVEAGVTLLFDSVVSEPVMQGNHCAGLIVENKSGRSFYPAGVVIDTTGDADVLYRAGVPCVQGGNFHTYIAHGMTLESCKKAVEAGDIRRAYHSFNGGCASLYGANHPDGMPLYTGTTGENVTKYLVDNQLELLGRLGEADRFARDLVMLPGMCQFRTTRHIDGDYTLKVSDQYRHFDDSISAINDFDQRDFLYEVPYRALIRTGYDNLITAGRTASGEGYAWDVLRVIPPAIVTGQAAGLAAAQALTAGCGIDEIDVSALQKTLAAQNVMIHFDDAWVPEKVASDARCDVGHL